MGDKPTCAEQQAIIQAMSDHEFWHMFTHYSQELERRFPMLVVNGVVDPQKLEALMEQPDDG